MALDILSCSRGVETVKNETKTETKSFYFYFCQKKEFRTYFVYFHTFSYKFKVQRTPTEFGPPVQPKVFQIYFVKKCLLSK